MTRIEPRQPIVEVTHSAGTNGAPPPAATAPALRITDLAIRYHTTHVLRDVNLDIPARRITAIVGPSGCGKSSFLMACNRLTDLIPGCHVDGAITFDQQNILDQTFRGPALRHLRARIGMIFQKPNPFAMSIRRNIALPLREHGVRDRRLQRERIERALRDVGLWDEVHTRLDGSALKLSGGQQQRLCIARALAIEPDILLMDEPCSALDPLATGRIEMLIRQLAEQYTIIIVTHNLAQARRIADHVAVIWPMPDHNETCGRIIEHGLATTVLNKPQHPNTIAYLQGDCC